MTASVHRLLLPVLLLALLFDAATACAADALDFNELSTARRVTLAVAFVSLFLAGSALVALVESILRARDCVDSASGQVDLGRLRAMVPLPRLTSVLIVAVAAYGITSSASLVELYRVMPKQWWDPELWAFERTMILGLLESPANSPKAWDVVYQSIWLVLFAGMAVLAKERRHEELSNVLMAIVIAFHMTRLAGIAFPTAGPVFYVQHIFQLDGTATAEQVRLLEDYMRGKVPQSGLMPGTMGMPSLHVGLAYLVVVALASHWRWSLALTVPFFALNWAATIFLGWHYAVDGVGGVMVMMCSLWLARRWTFICNLLHDRLVMSVRRTQGVD